MLQERRALRLAARAESNQTVSWEGKCTLVGDMMVKGKWAGQLLVPSCDRAQNLDVQRRPCGQGMIKRMETAAFIRREDKGDSRELSTDGGP